MINRICCSQFFWRATYIRGTYIIRCLFLFTGRSGGTWVNFFSGYVTLTSQSPYPIIVYSVASYRPHFTVSHWANM